MTHLPPPSVLLGIPKLSTWYPGQEDAFKKILDWFYTPSRFLGVSAATGAGKTALALLAAKMTGVRTCILTATKGLQEQYYQDAQSMAVLAKGQNNFKCSLVPTLNADEAPCHEGLSCSYARSGGCEYRVQLKKALESQIVITNYAYYLAQTRFSSGLGEFGLCILDEAHSSFSALESHLTTYLPKMELESLGVTFPSLPASDIYNWGSRKKTSTDPDPDTIYPPSLWAQWQMWASLSSEPAQERAEELSIEVKELRDAGNPVPGALSRSYRSAKSLSAKLSSLSSATGDWVIQKTYHGYLFTPRWVASNGSALFQTVPKVMLMSAILSHKTADSIGVPVGEDRTWLEVGSYFPPENTPIWHVPTARINYRTDDYGTTIWQARIDQIIQRRLDRKGIIFTVSYDRARLLMSRSRYKDIMLTHSTGDVSLVVNRFKAMKAPAVLVSPTVTTGWDFPAETTGVRYLIAGKIPYPDSQNIVLQARHKDDKDWSSYLAMETMIQELGRATRSVTDRVECLILDDNWIWYYNSYKKFAPKWFQERVKGSLTCVPDPLV
jgi:Rad3-related DNA helicase